MVDLLLAGAARLGLTLSTAQLQQFDRFTSEMLLWNQRMNLTGITAPEEIVVRHHLDSLTVALAFPGGLPPGARLCDIGAGAGFPGIPLKIVFPSLRLTLLESVRKKTEFLTHVVALLGLDDTSVVCTRAEEGGQDPLHREQYDIVTARAVAPLPALAEETLPLAGLGGCVVAPKKGDLAHELASAGRAISILGGRLRPLLHIDLPGLQDQRCLVIMDKVRPTPGPYPRRPGMPQKRPLQ
ncbi:MAG: 16S rRNA (guanine(527)-N(7))-methyltransferase RsmG [Dehalococcoidia bacterium]|nr:16S rRNA (guanine(527)-N(7))-methyltransferase RsmG [Dehalococcoidia bacterium]